MSRARYLKCEQKKYLDALSTDCSTSASLRKNSKGTVSLYDKDICLTFLGLRAVFSDLDKKFRGRNIKIQYHSAYVATSTESHRVEIDGFLYQNFM